MMLNFFFQGVNEKHVFFHIGHISWKISFVKYLLWYSAIPRTLKALGIINHSVILIKLPVTFGSSSLSLVEFILFLSVLFCFLSPFYLRFRHWIWHLLSSCQLFVIVFVFWIDLLLYSFHFYSIEWSKFNFIWVG